MKFSPRLKDKEEQGRKGRIKGDTMAQWINLFRNSIFVNPPPLPVLCEISGAVDLAEPDLTAGRQADEIQVNIENFRSRYRSK